MLRAMRALMEGRFADSDQLTEEVRGIGERHRDGYAIFSTKMHRLCRYYISEAYGELLSTEAEIRPGMARVFHKQIHVQQALTAWCQARAGLVAELEPVVAELRRADYLLRNRVFMPLAVEACCQVGDTTFAQQLYDRLLPERESFCPMQYSVSMAFFPPYTQQLGLLSMKIGRWQEAILHLEDALGRSEAIGLRSHFARLRYECAMAYEGRGEPGDRERTLMLLSQARELATELGQHGLLSRIDERLVMAADKPSA
jgi:hypothetical protein